MLYVDNEMTNYMMSLRLGEGKDGFSGKEKVFKTVRQGLL